MNRTRMLACLCSAMIATLLTACGGGNSSSATVSGSLSGLASGQSVTLTLNNGNGLTLNANGNFTFPGSLGSQAAYNVLVSAQPSGQTCLVSNGSGLISYSGDSVGNVAVNCVQNVSVGGSVTGLTAGSTLQVNNNSQNPSTATVANGTYSFIEALGAQYNLTINAQPAGLTCVFNASPAGVAANLNQSNSSSPVGGVSSLTPITNVNITCMPTSS